MITSAVVGTTIPVAVGHAYANFYKDIDEPVVCFFGDGAVEEGVFWESINFAAIKKLNIIFVCEDNGWAIHTHKTVRKGYTNFLDLVKPYEVICEEGNGNDPLDVANKTEILFEKMREQKKPGVLHLSYFRISEHVGVHDDYEAEYRKEIEGQNSPKNVFEEIDPLANLRSQILNNNWASESYLEQMKNNVLDQIETSVMKAKEDPFPSPEKLFQNI
ncbi:MAG: thiamine pyrophosphate-dependent enzyme, partial [Halobacteriovoraceae bacterium]|nr:thiamine pyrophosphate-dependent enzyme [Halobacteriovoraceae bacterium]